MIVESTPPTIQSLAAGDAGVVGDHRARHEQRSRAALGLDGELGRALADWLLAQGIREDACGVSLESKWGFEASPSGIRDPGIVPSGASTMPPPASSWHLVDALFVGNTTAAALDNSTPPWALLRCS